MTMTVIDTLRARLTECESEMSAINDASEKEQRLMTDEEKTKLVVLQSEHRNLKEELTLREGVLAAKASTSEPLRAVRPAGADAVRPAMSITQFGNKDNGGFRSKAEFYASVRNAAVGRVDNRLLAAASTYGSEGTQADGGYAVPTDFRRDIWSYVVSNDQLLPLTDQYNSFSNVLTFPADTLQPWNASVSASWTGEGQAIAESKTQLGQVSVTAYKLPVAINVTDELMQDALAYGAYVTRKAGERIAEAINYAILTGSGASQPKGCLVSSSALITVPSASGQAASTFVPKNVYDMYYRMPAQDRANAVWLVSPDAEPALQYGLNTNLGSGSAWPIFMPQGTIAGSPYGQIMGRPYLVNGNMKALGQKGDFAFVNLKRYLSLVKGGVQQDVSIHAYFLQDLSTFRFIVRMGGTPWVTNAITLQNGSTTQSPYVMLASR